MRIIFGGFLSIFIRLSELLNNYLFTMSLICCLCKFCNCVNLSFLKSTEGILKLAEIILGSICQSLLVSYGITYSLTLGSSYYSFLSTVSAGVFTSFILLICYITSSKSYQFVRQSIFEVIFNGVISLFYISSSCFLAFAIYTYLYPVYKIASIFQGYPIMSLTYVMGLIVGIAHAYDSWLAWKK